MTHYMKLNPQPFQQMACGQKTIELRLNDEKRQTIQIDDIIEFSNALNPNKIIRVKVVKLHIFLTFAELYKSIPLNKCGYLPQQLDTASPKDMEKYYSVAEQKKHGVMAIEIQLVN